jgi:predicted TIM-barrel fold metal-dependent hydrolase
MQAMDVAIDDSDTRFREAWMEIAEEDPESFDAFFADYAEAQTKNALLSGSAAGEWLTSPNLARMVRDNPDAANFLVTEELSVTAKAKVQAKAYLAFLKTFFRYRYENALTLSALHGEARGRRIGLFTPAMVDFDLWIGSEKCSETVPSSIGDQIALSARIATHSDQKIRCLAPFNPLRAIVDPGYFPLMEKAAGEFGCLGFKVYPPMGFAAYGNPDGMVRSLSCKKGITGAMVDEAMDRFFALCARERVPILAHGSPTNAPGGNAAKALLAGPNYWEQAFKKFPAYFKGPDPAVKVCIGHFGGISTKGHTHGWAGRLAELMKAHECLYVDTSYFEGLLTGGNVATALMGRLREAMGSAVVLERTLYGSDWSMLAQEVGADSYPATIEKALDDLGLKESAKDAIFYRNAYRFYGLQPGGMGRQRFLGS